MANDAFIFESINKTIDTYGVNVGYVAGLIARIELIGSGVISRITIYKQHHSNLRKICILVNVVVKAYNLGWGS